MIAFTTTPGVSGEWFCALAVAGVELLQLDAKPD